MIRQFAVSTELQQFLSGIQSKALGNVIFNVTFDDDAPVLPSNPSAVRRSLMFSKFAFTEEATPVELYNCFIQSLTGTSERSVSAPREF